MSRCCSIGCNNSWIENQGGCADLSKEDIKSLEIGLKNLEQHIKILRNLV